MALENDGAFEVVREHQQESLPQLRPAPLNTADSRLLLPNISSPEFVHRQSSSQRFERTWGSQERHAVDEEPLIWEKKTVLSCGGGGLRGLYQLYLLKALMSRVEFYELSQDEKNRATSSADSPLLQFHLERNGRFRPRSRVPYVEGMYLPCHYFDYVGGTSIGGIIAVMLGRLRMNVDEAIKDFKQIWLTLAATMSRLDRIMPLRKARKANSSGIDRAFGDLLSERKVQLNEFFQLHITSINFSMEHETVTDEFASDPELCKTIVVAMPDQSTSRDGLQRPCCFTTYRPYFEGFLPFDRRDGSGWAAEKKEKLRIKDVCNATAAARGTFKGVVIDGIKYRDGAIWTANPAFEIFSEIETRLVKRDRIHLLVGLGSGPKKAPKFRFLKQKSTVAKGNSTVDTNLEGKLGSRYCHFEGPDELPDIEINDWRIDGSGLKTFQSVQKATESYCNSPDVKGKIDRCAKILVNLRQRRAKTAHWERFALGIRYVCRHDSDCSSSAGDFDNANAYVSHLMWDHGEPPQDETHWNHIQDLLKKSQLTTVT